MKSTQRLNYNRFADSLVERGLVGQDVANHVLHQCNTMGTLFPELLVTEELVSDWEVSRVCSELYHLPFLPVDMYQPSTDALDGLDPEYLRTHCLVPLDRFGKILTVAMPGIVPTEVLEGISREEGGRVIPVVGTVKSNRRWLQDHLPAPTAAAAPAPAAAIPETPIDEAIDSALEVALDLDADGAWEGIFDAGEEAVQLDLQQKDEPE